VEPWATICAKGRRFTSAPATFIAASPHHNTQPRKSISAFSVEDYSMTIWLL
jgi:hypothetical protein